MIAGHFVSLSLSALFSLLAEIYLLLLIARKTKDWVIKPINKNIYE